MSSKKKPEIAIENMLLLAKLSDGTIRQVVTTKDQQLFMVDLLIKTSKDGVISIHEPPIESIDWESKFDLYTIENK